MVVDVPDYRFLIVEKYAASAEVVRRRIEADDKVSRKKVRTAHFICAFRIDKDVGKRCCRVAHIAASVEDAQQLADLPVYAGHLVFPLPNVYGRVVSFVINQKHWCID